MDFAEAILLRRSASGSKPDWVPREVLKDIQGIVIRSLLEMNTQPWEFTTIS